jgi:hypothetical protein
LLLLLAVLFGALLVLGVLLVLALAAAAGDAELT